MDFTQQPKRDYVIGLPDAGLWKLRFNSDAKTYSDNFEGFFSSDAEAFEGGRMVLGGTAASISHLTRY